MNALLEVKALSKSFASTEGTYPVLTNINLQVNKGDFLCIVGPSGCGKSTLLVQLAGLEKPDSGGIYLNGECVTKPQTNRLMVFQEFNQLFPWKTVLNNVIFPLKLHKIDQSNAERKALAKTYLDLVQLNGYENFYPHQLSGGMKQRAAIARALAMKSEILLMDEPFGSLDAQSRTELQQMLLDIWQATGITIVFVTHDINEALLLSNRIAVMGRSPENIKKIIDNNVQRPRNQTDKAFGQLYDEILALLK